MAAPSNYRRDLALQEVWKGVVVTTIVKTFPPIHRRKKTRFTAEEAAYFEAVRQISTCACWTLWRSKTCHGKIVAAHINRTLPSIGHSGRGKGQKAHFRWVVPLCDEHHRYFDAGGQDKVSAKALGEIALALFGRWIEDEGDLTKWLPAAERIVRG